MAGSEGRDPISDLEILRKEISEYDEDLAKFPWKVIANKMDLEGAAENLEIFKQRFPKVEVISISANTGEGLDDLRVMLDSEVSQKSKK
jgi:GTP-binding protein